MISFTKAYFFIPTILVFARLEILALQPWDTPGRKAILTNLPIWALFASEQKQKHTKKQAVDWNKRCMHV